MHYPSVVDALTDEELLSHIDALLRASDPPFDRVMTRLVELDWKPSGQGSAFVLALALFTKSYVKHRDEADVMESVRLAQAEVLAHPVISKVVAQTAGSAVDSAVGVA
jgi:hypothetical protein